MADPNNALIARHKLVMMFICKAGNTSVKRALADALKIPNFDAPERLQPHRRFDLAFPTPNKMDAYALRQRNYLVCGIVRHPLARLVSCYEDKVCGDKLFGPLGRKYDGKFRHGMPFEAFVKAVASIPDGQADQHFRSMSWDMLTESGELIPNRLFKVDSPDWWGELRTAILDHCRVDIGGERRENKSTHADWREYYSPATQHLAEKRYARDMTEFGYGD